METTELSCLCRSIRQAVAAWLSHQHEITCAVHRIAVKTIQECCEAPPMYIIQDLHEQYPEGWVDYGEVAVAFRAFEILNSEFKPLSDLFGTLYQDFNQHYFGASLPPCYVQVMHSLRLPEQPFTPEDICAREVGTGRILLQYNGWPDDMIVRLVHLMAHLKAGPGHGVEFEATLASAQRLGAPSEDDVKRLRQVPSVLLTAIAKKRVLTPTPICDDGSVLGTTARPQQP